MSKEEMEKLYEELGYEKVDDLYFYNCLLISGFDKDTSYDLINLLRELWLKDETNTCISTLSDMLYDIYNKNKNNVKDKSARELLVEMFLESECD